MRAIYLDCFAGISGNMLLGALLNVGVPEKFLREELAKLPVSGYDLNITQVSKCGITAVYVDVQLHQHHHHEHRHLCDIFQIIDNSSFDVSIKEKSKKIFMCLAQAEAKVHGTTVDDIHFHEVGAVDAIIDIVGAVLCLHYLEIEEIYTSKLQVGTGFIQCSHGLMPVPAPATAELLKNIPYYNGDIAKELVTPTGAAIIATLGSGYGAIPETFKTQKIGYGAGTWELIIPNVLRIQVGDIMTRLEQNETLVLEANIDDLNPQIYAYVLDKLLAVGVLDVWLTPVVMKKSRPATILSILINSELLPKVVDIVLTETSTIGIRHYPVQRNIAERHIITVLSPWGQARVKISSYGGQVCSVTPEYEDCRLLAEKHNVPLKAVLQKILQLALQNSEKEITDFPKI
ncbi:MAG TPA: nickel pincer cofactor biosynthesis protein LarC [Negativicutes bacterium]